MTAVDELIAEVLRVTHSWQHPLFITYPETAHKLRQIAIAAQQERVGEQEGQTQIRGPQNLSEPESRETGPSVDANVSRDSAWGWLLGSPQQCPSCDGHGTVPILGKPGWRTTCRICQPPTRWGIDELG